MRGGGRLDEFLSLQPVDASATSTPGEDALPPALGDAAQRSAAYIKFGGRAGATLRFWPPISPRP